MTSKEIIASGNVWNESSLWNRKCHSCSGIISHKRKENAITYYKQNRICHSCANRITSTTRIWTEQRRINHKKSLVGRKPSFGMKGKHQSEEAKRKISLNSAKSMLGQKHSVETKRRMRQIKVERFNRLGIGTRRDFGANEYFQRLNEQGYNFEQEKYFRELGYYADGYDGEKHIWMEYDTEYHKIPKQRIKDEMRQNRIVEYFKGIGHPITFLRIDASIL